MTTSDKNLRKNFVLDTNVVLHDPNAIYRFGNNNVIIPIYVIEEVDTFKRQLNELGRSARLFSRFLDAHREQGNLREGVAMENGGTIRVIFAQKILSSDMVTKGHEADNMIMSVALQVSREEPDRPCIFITKDTNLRIRADALGLHTENYEADGVSIDELYPGATEIAVPGNLVDKLYEQGELNLGFEKHPTEVGAYTCPELSYFSGDEHRLIRVNEYVRLRDEQSDKHTVLARFLPQNGRIITLRKLNENTWGIKPRNREQSFALDCLLDDSISLVTLLGKAGTGKTLLALAAGLSKVTDDQCYSKLLVARPIFPLGKDIGYLPGGIEEKLNPWMQPIFDNIEFLLGFSQADKRSGRSYRDLIDYGALQIEALTYIRGRSIPKQFIIIDEAQNLTPHEVKTIVTRVGDKTKVVFTGDPYQIDNPYVDSESNGLTYLINKFKGQEIAATVTLQKGERSKLAELAANLL